VWLCVGTYPCMWQQRPMPTMSQLCRCMGLLGWPLHLLLAPLGGLQQQRAKYTVCTCPHVTKSVNTKRAFAARNARDADSGSPWL
jgi:hypothetical protein